MILSQSDGTNTMYFQYDTNNIPFGFIFNGVQYFYLTNHSGDVLGITEENGNFIAQYLYDEWGNLLYIDSDDRDDTAVHLTVAEANPLRYRGYYYDAETGYYYLQSRYYDSEICRFINADFTEIAKVSKSMSNGVNIFVYCNNDSVNNSDPSGCFSGVIVYFYKQKNKKINSGFFGHLDIQIDNTLYSYASYESGNFLITTNISAYHQSQRSKYSIVQCKINVSAGEKACILSFYRRQKNISSWKTRKVNFDTSGKSNIYKINSGKYKDYKLRTVNCSTFVLDGLTEAFNVMIAIFRTIQIFKYLFQVLNTPTKVFEICQWLANYKAK